MRFIRGAGFALTVFLLTMHAGAQTNAVPFVAQALNPASTAPGKAFTLTVNGTGFAPAAVVNWNGVPQLTEVISTSQLKASISAADVATPRTASISVTNPAPGGGTSNIVFFPVRATAASIGMAITQAFPNAKAVVVGDFNNDGNLDVVWVDDNFLNTSLGNGKGGFQAPITNSEGSLMAQMVTGDFNGDGKLDLAGIGSGTLLVFLGNGDGTFTESLDQPVFNGGISGVGTADFNQDGHLDIYVAGWETGPTFFEIYLGKGDGTFSLGGSFNTGDFGGPGIYPQMPAIGDFNGDGYLDLAIGGPSTGGRGNAVQVWLGSAAAYFTELGTIEGAYAGNIAAADVNDDGKLDLVTDIGCVLTGNGDGTFQPCSALPYSGELVGTGDFTGNRQLDVVTSSSVLAVNLGAGNGTFSSAFTFGVQDSGLAYGAIGDFNNDGKLDAVTSNGSLLIQTTVDLTPISLAFGSQNVGTKSTAQMATLTNVGTAALTIGTIGIKGTGSADFTQANGCGSSLAPGASCTISVVFAPKSAGIFAASLIVNYEGIGSPQSVALSGAGVAPPTVTLLPSNLQFSMQLVGTKSAAQTATLTNTGAQPVTISGIAASLPFSETNSCPSSLGTGESCTIAVTFAPAKAGGASGTLSVTDDAANSPQKVILKGTGTVLSISPAEINFGDEKVGTRSASAPITVTNVGGNAISISSIAVTGTNGGDFSQANNCRSRLAAQATCTIKVTFKPTATGARSAAVTLTDNGGGSPQSIALSGTGT